MSNNSVDDIIIGQSAPAKELKKLIQVVAEAPTSVLVLGETGTGKELVARAIHAASGRGADWFPSIARQSRQNCWNLRSSAMKKVLSPVLTNRARGVSSWRAAAPSSLMKSAICRCRCQTKLLRVLENRTVQRVGGNDEK